MDTHRALLRPGHPPDRRDHAPTKITVQSGTQRYPKDASWARAEVVQQSGNSAIHALYSVVPRSYARDRLCLVGDAGAVFPPFTGSGVLKAVANATSLADALAEAPAVDDALRRWSQAQLQVAAQVVPMADHDERSQVFDMPDLAAMPTAATNDWMSAAYPGFDLTLPEV
jgi:2-polyprenyl-6-methoxyphenol hydroxylase-like FAD-dependent oxidoreductase